MKKILALFYWQIQTLLVFVLFIVFIYFPNLNSEINLLPFQINNISWRAAWYYIVIFILVWLFIYFRVYVVNKLFEKFSLKDIILANSLISILGIPFFFLPHFRLLGGLLIFFALLLNSIDFFMLI